MKNFVLKIAEESGLKITSLNLDELDLYLANFDTKDDFYLFLFIDEEKIQTEFKELKDVEYAMNRIANTAKSLVLKEYKERALENNLSFLIFISSKLLSQEIYSARIEENQFVAKKYVLEYEQENLIKLKEKIEDAKRYSQQLCFLASKYGHTLNDKNHNSWYLLLLKMFIKIPFFNYQPEYEGSIPNLEQKINQRFSNEDQDLFDLIEEAELLSKDRFEDFLLEKNLL